MTSPRSSYRSPGPVVIRVHEVTKQFKIRNDKSLKERIVNAGRSRRNEQRFTALSGVSVDIHAGETVGLIGANGSGKSTLLKVIGGILAPNQGYVERRGRLAALLELGAGFHGDLTGRENVYLNASILGLTRAQTDHYFDEIIDFSGIEPFIDTQVKFYSSGMYVRLAFAVAIHVDPEILLIDEVLAVGDEAFQRKCMDRIKQFQREGRTIVFVTHGLDQVRQLCDRVVLLEKGHLKVDGTPIEGIRALREQFNEVEEDRPAESGGDRVRITDVRVTDGNGVPKNRFRPGDRLGLELDVDPSGPIDDWVAGILLTDALDLGVYGTNSTLQSVELPAIDSPITVRYTFDDIPLVEGQYHVTAAVHPRVGPEYHRLDRITAFKVFSDLNDDGVVFMRPKLEVVQP